MHDDFDVADQQTNRRINHTLTVLPGNIKLYLLDVQISGYRELLKLQTKICLVQCVGYGHTLVYRRKLIIIQNKKTGKNINMYSNTKPKTPYGLGLQFTVYDKEPNAWIRCRFKKLFII